jgi:hypothetical protein
MPLYRQCAISLDRPRFQLFGSLHLVVDESNNDLLHAPQECNEQMGAIEMGSGTTAKGGGVRMAWDRRVFPLRFRSVDGAVDS